ncbi:MAG: hypothetical protein KKH72_11625 [Alphaproteobacteria bacterium]|nr:hypothetical protein [Alphaproteobacteria bacterium]
MKYAYVLKAAAALLFATGLAGCFDVKFDVAVLDTDKASVVISTTVPKELVDLAEIESGTSEFCKPEDELIEGEADYTCVSKVEGTFAEVFEAGDPGEPQPTIETVGPRQFKVSFPAGSLQEDMSGQAGGDAEALEMMKQMFEGHAITIRVSGGTIIDTNMTKNEAGDAAETVLPFIAIIEGTADIPDVVYAVVELK